MRFRFVLSHDESGSTVEISECDGWRDSILKLERHEEFHSLIEYFEGSFIFYGANGIVDGGANHIREWVRDYGLDTTIEIQISLTFDDVTFSEVFNGQLGVTDIEELPNNKLRAPIIRDDRWSKFIARLDTPVNIQSITDLDGNVLIGDDKVKLRLSSQTIKYSTTAKIRNSYFYGAFETQHKFMQVDWDEYELDEVEKKYNYPISFNSDIPFEKYDIEFAGDYYLKVRIYITHAGVIIGGGGSVSFDAYYDMTRVGPDVQMILYVNNVESVVFTQTDLGTDGVDGYSRYDLETTLTLNAKDKITISAKILTVTIFTPILLGVDTSTTGTQVDTIQQPPGGSVPPNFPSGLTDDNEFTVTALTTFPETDSESFLLHDAAGYIIDRITGEEGIFYSELLGSPYTQYREYIEQGCAWKYALVKGLQLRGYNLTDKPFFQSFNQWWKGANPILNLALSYETLQIPYIIDASPDINLIEDLASWDNEPLAGWDFVFYGHPFVSVNGNGGLSGYTVGDAPFNEDQPYQIDVTLFIQTTGAETPDCIVTYAILDSIYGELATREFQYIGPGTKSESFILIPEGVGAFFAVKIENNTPFETKNFEITYAFSEDAQVGYNTESVIRIEDKASWYDDSEGTIIDFSNIRDISRKFDNDRIFNKVSIGYARWESEDISGIDDPQTKKTYATRFKKAGKGIDLYSEFIAASLVIEQARRTSKIKSADYKYDNETFIIALNEVPQDESPDISPDILTFIPELDENFTTVENLQSSDTRYNLKLTPARNFLRWQNFLQGALQSYLGSYFTFTSGEGNYDAAATMDPNGCTEDYEGISLDEKGDILADTNYLHLPELYEITIPMDWNEYQLIRDNRKRPIGISLSDSGHVAMFIKTLQYKPVKGTCEILAWSKEYLDLSYYTDHTPMQECLPVPGAPGGPGGSEECEGAITDDEGNILTDEFGECIFEGDSESEGIPFDFPLDSPF